MKLLLDQGLPRGAAQLLREAGLDAIHTGECGLSTASDSVLLRFAREEGRVVVTLDADFHTILALSGACAPSTIRVRIEGLRAGRMAELIQWVVERTRDELSRGAMVSVTETQVRVRPLPIQRAGDEQQPELSGGA